jgi:hypothetical protein
MEHGGTGFPVDGLARHLVCRLQSNTLQTTLLSVIEGLLVLEYAPFLEAVTKGLDFGPCGPII